MTDERRYEATGVRCLECLHVAQADTEAAKRGFGKCGAAVPPHYVSVIASRNCLAFDPAEESAVRARDAWAAKLKMFWQK